MMNLPYSDKISIGSLSRLFENTSECYKFFWFQAIVSKVIEGKDVMEYDELLNEMIVNAWYMVTEYHLNLGPRDTLEILIHELQNIAGLKSSETKENILAYMKSCAAKEIKQKKVILTKNVPYRLQAPFIEGFSGKGWHVPEKKLIEQINCEKALIYYFGEYAGLNTPIHVQKEWASYIRDNQDIIKGWLQYNLIMYLQRRNPNVPGISDKLYPPKERKLEKVKRYWKLIASIQPIYDIYGHEKLDSNDLSIDHFVPWSYVAHDEFWNLHPTTKVINSSKSNHLPDWNTYFKELAHLEYFSYELMWKNSTVYDSFEKCAREHLNSLEISGRLYREGQDFITFANALEEIVLPVYQSAKNCGFKNWIYSGNRENEK